MSAQTVRFLGALDLAVLGGAAIGWIGRGVFEVRRRRNRLRGPWGRG